MTDYGSSKLSAYQGKLRDLERARREVDEARSQAIRDLVLRRTEIDRELRILGYVSDGVPGRGIEDLLEPGASSTTSASAKARRKSDENVDCPYCHVRGHDGRAHRGQGQHKRAFTHDELRARGLLSGKTESTGGSQFAVDAQSDAEPSPAEPRRRRRRPRGAMMIAAGN
jgi:hypothetical protein